MIDEEGKEFKELLNKYEQYLIDGKSGFFDEDDLLDIIDYYYEHSENDKVSSAIDLGIALYPDNIEFIIRKAQHINSFQSSRVALTFLLNYYSQYYENYDYAYYLAFLYSGCKMPEKSIEIYTSLLAKNSKNKEVLYSLGNIYMTTQQWQNATDAFFRLLHIDEKNENALEAISFCSQYTQDTDKYLTFLHTLCHRNPYSEPNWTYYGLLLYYMGRFEDANEAFTFALSIDSDSLTAHIYKGQCLTTLGDIEEGVSSLLDALALSPDTSLIHLFIAKAYEKQGDFRSAVNYYRSCVKYEQDNTEALMGCGICYFELDEFSKATPYVKRALKLDPHNTQNLLTYAEMLYKEGYTKAGEEIYQELYEKKESLDLIASNWAMAMSSVGKNFEGISLINNTIANNSFDDAMIYLVLLELSNKEQYLQDTLADELTSTLTKFKVSLSMIKEYCPSLLTVNKYEQIIKEHIYED